MKYAKIGSTLLLLFSLIACSSSRGPEAGGGSGSSVIWQPGADVEDFWTQYTSARGGLTWGSGDAYPPYSQVKEGDTFLVQLEEGPCLMEFFHSRWRRANDVRRWDPSINKYGGCPYVFDE